VKRYLLPLVGGLAAFSTSLVLSGCGASADDGSAKTGDPGTSEKDFSSNSERHFEAPDEFYDYGDYAYVKVFHLTDGTRCVMAADRENGGMGITCEWPQETPSSLSTDTP
jgi:hypothetical protein